MTQYLMSVWHGEDVYENPPDNVDELEMTVDAFNQKLQKAGAWVFGGGLHPASTATVVRPEGDEVLVTDGPYSEAKEQIGGFWVIEAADLDAALQWTKEAAVACRGAVELRPFDA